MPRIPAQLRLVFQDMISVFQSRQKFIAFLKTLSLVAPLTVLIWISAERTQVVDTLPFYLELEVHTANANQSAELSESSTGFANVSITLNGSNSQIQQIMDTIRSQNNRINVILADNQTNGNDKLLRVKELLNNDPLFKTIGVTVTSAQPLEIKVNIEPFEIRSNVPVTLESLKITGDQNIAVEHVVPDPYQVEVRGPKSVLDQLFAPTGSGVITAIDKSTLTTQDLSTSGTKTFENVKLVLDTNRLRPGQADLVAKLVTIKPKQLTSLRFDIAAEQMTTIEFKVIPVTVNKPIARDDKSPFVVTYSKLVSRNVKIKGPSTVVEKIRMSLENQEPDDPEKPSKVVAQLNLIKEDFENSNLDQERRRTPVIINLPPNVTVEGKLETIDFTVSRTTPVN